MAKRKILVPEEYLIQPTLPTVDSGYIILGAYQSENIITGLYQKRQGYNPEKLVCSKDDIELLLTGPISTHYHTASGTTYQISPIVGATYGWIDLHNFVGIDNLSHNIKIDMHFGELANSNYRISAHRSVELSMIVYTNLGTTYHSNSNINITSHGGTVVLVSNQTSYDVLLNDIEITPVFDTGTKKLKIRIKNNIESSTYFGASSALKCQYTIVDKKFIWTSGTAL